MDSKDIYDAAEAHWPAMVNRDRTYLHLVVLPQDEFDRQRNREAWDDMQKHKHDPAMHTVSLDAEPVGENYLMAYDPLRDKLYVWTTNPPTASTFYEDGDEAVYDD